MLHRWWFNFLTLSVSQKIKWLLFAFILCVAAYARFFLPFTPFADHDLRGYLNPALQALTFHEFVHSNCRSFPYPLFVFIVTAFTHSLHGITIVQHKLGLITGILLFLMFEQSVISLLVRGYVKWLATALQLICAGYFLLAGDMIIFEHTIRPESVAVFLLIVLLYLLVSDTSRSTLYKLSSALFLALFLSVFFPRWGFALPVVLLYVVWRIVKTDSPGIKKLISIAIPLIIFFGGVWLPERYLVKNYDPSTDGFLGRQFFYSHADIARQLILDGVTNNGFNSSQRLRIADILKPETPADNHFQALGFSPDELMYGKTSRGIDSILLSAGDSSDSFYAKYDRQIIARAAYAQRVWHELLNYYVVNTGFARIYPFEQPVYRNLYVTTNAGMFYEMENGHPFFSDYKSEVNKLQDYVIYGRFRFLNGFYFVLQITFLPIVIVFLIAWFAQMFNSGPPVIALRPLAAICWCFLLVHLGMVLSVAAVHTFGIERYGISIFPVAIITQSFLVLYVTLVFQNKKV